MRLITHISVLIPITVMPFRIFGKIEPGCRVLVPFGRGNNERYGIVLSVTDGDTSTLKEISKIIDKPLSDEMIQLALWLKTRCFCTTYDCLKQMLPRRYGSLKIKSRKWYALKTVLNPIQR